MKKVLISGIFYEGGGLGNVMNYLTTHLSADMDISCMAFLPGADANPQKFNRQQNRVYNIPMSWDKFILPEDHEVCREITDGRYDSIILLGPISMNSLLIEQLKGLNNEVRLIAFIPYEGKVVNLSDAGLLNTIDFGVFYSRFTYDCFNELNTSNPCIFDFSQRFGYINHGIDKGQFYPLSNNRKEKIKKARSFITEYKDLPEDAFIVLNSNKPFYRKGLAETIAGFRKFSLQHSNCYLHLHLGSTSKFGMDKKLNRLNPESLNGKLIVTYSDNSSETRSVEWMNYLYNACNVGLSTSSGEGWGLGIFEHAATGAPVIVPGHTSFIENWKDIAILTETGETKFHPFENTEIYLSDVNSVCNALNSLYHSAKLYEYCAQKCFENATSSKYNWENSAAYFRYILVNHQIRKPLHLTQPIDITN